MKKNRKEQIRIYQQSSHVRNFITFVLIICKYKHTSEKAMATQSSTLAWKIPWTEEPGRLPSMWSLGIRHDFTFTFTFHFHALEKEIATHSSILVWRIPGTGEPGGLQSTGSHRVGPNWSDLATAAAANTCMCAGSSHEMYFLLRVAIRKQLSQYDTTSLIKWEIH